MPIYSNKPADLARVAFLKLAAEGQSAEAESIRIYKDYYQGDQGSLLTQRLAEFLNVRMGTSFAVNVCSLVVDSLVERLQVSAFKTESESVNEVLWSWWQRNRMDANQDDVYLGSARDGVSYVIVDWDDERGIPRFSVNDAWDGFEGIKMHWRSRPGPGQQVVFASKRWREDFDENGEISPRRRLNLYFPDRVEKYISGVTQDESGWEKYQEEGEPWPTPWVDVDGNPLGIPVIPFLNKRGGHSELRDVIAPQDALNKTVIDLIASADAEGFGIYTKVGGQFISSPQVAPGAFWQDTDPMAKFDKLPPTSLAQIIEALWVFMKTVAIVTRRPLSLFVGQASGDSGESLKERESGLVAQARAATRYFGNAWEDVLRMAARLNQVYGDGSVDPEIELSAEWQEVEARDDDAHRANIRQDFQAGLIDAVYAWTELGIPREQQVQMERRIEVKAQKDLERQQEIFRSQAEARGGVDKVSKDERQDSKQQQVDRAAAK